MICENCGTEFYVVSTQEVPEVVFCDELCLKEYRQIWIEDRFI